MDLGWGYELIWIYNGMQNKKHDTKKDIEMKKTGSACPQISEGNYT